MLPDVGKLRRLVQEAAQLVLLPKFAEVTRSHKADGSMVTGADLAMQRHLQNLLLQHWPQYAFLGEEMQDHDHERLLASAESGLWCLDPLDGTSNFATGIPYFAVSLALLIRNEPVIGLVYDPIRDECFTAVKGGGAWLNDVRIGDAYTPGSLRRCVAAVDFKRLFPKLAVRLGEDPPYGSQRNFGACALDWCWLAVNRFHLSLHGGQKLWDHAAGNFILIEAGGYSTTLEGESVFAASMSPRSVVAAREHNLFSAWRDWLAHN